jgi:hypothetical protein
LALAFVVLLAASAFAVNKGSLQVNSDVSVNGKQLKAGDYSVTWDGEGPDVQLSILQGKKVVAQTAAKVVTMNAASGNNEAVVSRDANGGTSLQEIRFRGKKIALAISPAASAGSGSAGSASSN